MKTNQTASLPLLAEITPSNLSSTIDSLKPGEEIRISKEAGVIKIRVVGIVGGKREIRNVEQRLYTGLNPIKLSPTWMGRIEPPLDKQARSGHKKEMRDKVKRGRDEFDALRVGLIIGLSDIDMSCGTVVKKTGEESFWMFQVGDWEVYTKANKIPVKAKKPGSEMVHFESVQEFDPTPKVMSI